MCDEPPLTKEEYDQLFDAFSSEGDDSAKVAQLESMTKKPKTAKEIFATNEWYQAEATDKELVDYCKYAETDVHYKDPAFLCNEKLGVNTPQGRKMSTAAHSREKELLDYLLDILSPEDRWPDSIYKAFYTRELKSKQRWNMACFFWYNGVDPEIVYEWYTLRGVFNDDKFTRKRELESCFKTLNDNKDNPFRMRDFFVFSLEANDYVRIYVPVPVYDWELPKE
jgi:hypothetical protein